MLDAQIAGKPSVTVDSDFIIIDPIHACIESCKHRTTGTTNLSSSRDTIIRKDLSEKKQFYRGLSFLTLVSNSLRELHLRTYPNNAAEPGNLLSRDPGLSFSVFAGILFKTL